MLPADWMLFVTGGEEGGDWLGEVNCLGDVALFGDSSRFNDCWFVTPCGMGLGLEGPESRSTTPLNWPDWDRVWDFLEAGGGGSCPTVGWFSPTCWTGLSVSREGTAFCTLFYWSAVLVNFGNGISVPVLRLSSLGG